MAKNIKYVEPASYFPKSIRDKFKKNTPKPTDKTKPTTTKKK